MSAFTHWHGVPSSFDEPAQCCVVVLERVLAQDRAAADAERERALVAERRRIVKALTEGVDAWERTAASLADQGVVASVALEVRHLLAAAGCTCPQVEITTPADAKPRYIRGRDRYCAVHA